MKSVELTEAQWSLILHALAQYSYDLAQRTHREIWINSRRDIAKTIEDINDQLPCN